MGGFGDKTFDRAARLADGFIFFGGDVDTVVNHWNALRARVRSYGRQIDDFGADWVVTPRSRVSDVTDEVEAWQEAGGTHVTVPTVGLGLDSIDGHLDYVSSLAGALKAR
jgi:hypothetical protein